MIPSVQSTDSGQPLVQEGRVNIRRGRGESPSASALQQAPGVRSPSHVSGRPGPGSIRRSASTEFGSAQRRLSVSDTVVHETVERLEEHYCLLLGAVQEKIGQLKGYITGLQSDFHDVRSTLEAEQTQHQEASEALAKKEEGRKKHAVEKAKARDAEISSLKEQLLSTQQRSSALEEYADNKADRFIEHAQKEIDSLSHQLGYLRFKRDEAGERVGRLVESNVALTAKNKEVVKSGDEFMHQMNVQNKDLMDATVRAREQAGLALIQRDLARAKVQQHESGTIAAVGSSSSRDDNVMRALVQAGPRTTETEDVRVGREAVDAMRQGAQQAGQIIEHSRAEITPEMRISILESNNLALTAANESLSMQVKKEKETVQTLLGVNKASLAEVRKYKQALETLCQKVGLSLDDIVGS